MEALNALGPLDGRYAGLAAPLAALMSEAGLIRYRVIVEAEYLIALAGVSGIGVRALTKDEIALLRSLSDDPGLPALASKIELQGIEGIPATNHDLKAVEYAMKQRLAGTSLKDVLEWIHFGLTSEDANNIAYALMLRDALKNVLIPAMKEVRDKFDAMAKEYASAPMLARTHGQPATPTTFGKECRVFAARIDRQLASLLSHQLQVKLAGASGNWNAHAAAYPSVDWIAFARRFIESFEGLEMNMFATQIEPHDSYAELFDNVKRLNTVLIDASQDFWWYISGGWIVQKPKEGEVGSSTMPHKVNPIDFENAEGNLGLANALFEFFSRKLPVSRLQRDLSDSTVERNFGAAFGHCLIAYKKLLKGLDKVRVDAAKIQAELEAHPEVIAEAIQTILRREGAAMPYEKLKALTRGKQVTLEDIRAFIDGLDVSASVKEELKKLTPSNYMGLAGKLAKGEK